MGGEKMQRKYKLLAIIVICALATSTVAALGPTIASWTQSSIVNLTSAPATDSFTTTVTGVATNAVETPITVNGVAFVSSDINGYVLAVAGGDGANPSTVSLSASNFLPGDYAQFAVTIKNTGSATLQFQQYTILDQFVNSGGTAIVYTFPSTDPYNANYVDPIKPAATHPWTIADWGTDNLATFQLYLTDNTKAGCASTWCQDNAYTSGTLPSTLAPGASFTYNLFTGLGNETVYGIPACHYQISIPLMPAA
jgi:hypothetical protein